MKTHFFMAVILLMLGSASQAQVNNQLVNEENNEAKIQVAKTEVKKNVVKLYSRKEKGTVIVTSHRPQQVRLYIFDLEGSIMYQTDLKKNEKRKIDSLAKGTYTYTIFDNDESIEEGTILIK